MKNSFFLFLLPIALFNMVACTSSEPAFDATGSFEADEIIVSAEVAGIVQQFEASEGSQVKAGAFIGLIDTTLLHFKKQQLLAQLSAIEARKPDATTQLAALHAQWQNASQEMERSKKLLAGQAASVKQVDDLAAQTEQLEKQYKAQVQQLQKSTSALQYEMDAIRWQLEQVEEQLRVSYLACPVDAILLKQFVQRFEMVQPGKPLYKLANLKTLYLRVYLTSDQLAKTRLGQVVKVHTDDGAGGMQQTEGKIMWVSDKAEFTPKSIQTKDERANQVYAVKIAVVNNGTLKIGMYGQMAF